MLSVNSLLKQASHTSPLLRILLSTTGSLNESTGILSRPVSPYSPTPTCKKRTGPMRSQRPLTSSIVNQLQSFTWILRYTSFSGINQTTIRLASSGSSASLGYGRIRVTSLRIDPLRVSSLAILRHKVHIFVFNRTLVAFMCLAMSGLTNMSSLSRRERFLTRVHNHHQPHLHTQLL